VSLHGNNSGAESTRELFKPSKDLVSLRVCNEKNWGVGFFVRDVMSGVILRLFDPLHLALVPNI